MNTKLNVLAGIALLTIAPAPLAMASPPEVNAQEVAPSVALSSDVAQLLAEKPTIHGRFLTLPEHKTAHLVFMDIWNSYAGQGAEQFVAALPEDFLAQSQQIWIQPEINVTTAQLKEFQGYYPMVAPLVLDRSQQLLRQFQFWQTPSHVLVEEGKVVFQGDNTALLRYLNQDVPEPSASLQAQEQAQVQVQDQEQAQEAALLANKTVYHVPKPGESAPPFTVETLSGERLSLAGLLNPAAGGQPVSLLFMDALCPMPQFPDCEAKLAQWRALVQDSPQRQWVGVISGFYIDESIARAFAEKHTLDVPVVFDVDNQLFQQYGVHASPYQIDIGADGTLVSRSEQIR
ncbi:peroxiredoxin family protein [Photobacterium sp. TY1-4]|uniref:peroxiredoxin family protein n=1 Tax=Photobacterium sp. TY1-4 TaxID=2899122 RepID=UPI0021C1D8D7|nr:peroxiredoxin family protein [Photobacterium sp. TY1-4]UXI00980.1 peroxiredoxin family protein [Photobacterium sp. TY1-4]